MAFSTDKIIEECNDLIRFDHDAIGAYDQAIDQIQEQMIRDQLMQFRSDHERHVTELSAIVRRMGGDPPEKPGARGLIRSTMTKVAGLGGTETVLKAMKSNEEVLNKQYANRAKEAFPQDILEVIQRNYDDEKRHLAWIEQCLQNRLWEQQPAHP
jgi:uncharacterized protein (TIGR02284 family)